MQQTGANWLLLFWKLVAYMLMMHKYVVENWLIEHFYYTIEINSMVENLK